MLKFLLSGIYVKLKTLDLHDELSYNSIHLDSALDFFIKFNKSLILEC